MVINIAAFVEEPLRSELIRSAKIREETLVRCYNMDGYRDLPLNEKNKIYDSVKQQVELEI